VETNIVLAIPFNIFSDPKYCQVKLIGDEVALHAFNASLGKTIKKYDVFSIDEERKMFLQPIYQLTSPTNFNMKFGYFFIQNFYIRGAQNSKILSLKIYFLFRCLQGDAPPSSLMDSTASPKVKTIEGEGIGVRSLARSILGVEGHARAPGWD
jgi:hypothetical protein